MLLAEDDRGRVLVAGRELEVEQAARVETTPILQTYPGRTGGEFKITTAFAAIKADGTVVTWGYSQFGGDSSGVADRLSSGVSQIFPTRIPLRRSRLIAPSSPGGPMTAVGWPIVSAPVSNRSSPLRVPLQRSRLMALSSPGVVMARGATAAGLPIASAPASSRSSPLRLRLRR